MGRKLPRDGTNGNELIPKEFLFLSSCLKDYTYPLSLQSEQLILLKFSMCCPINGSWSTMVVGFMGVEHIVGFVISHVVVGADNLAKFAYSL